MNFIITECLVDQEDIHGGQVKSLIRVKKKKKIAKPNLSKILAMTVPVIGTGVSGFGVASLINMGVNPVAIGASNVLFGRRLYKVLNEEKLDNKNIKRGMQNFDSIMGAQTNL